MPSRPILVCFPFVGDEIGGSHVSALKLVEALNPARVTPLVMLHSPDGPLAAYLRERGIAFAAAPVGPPPERGGGMAGFALRAIRPLARFLAGKGVDVVHTNDGRIHALWALPARLAGARQLWHHRGDPDARAVNLLAPFLAGHVVTVSRFARPRRPLLPLGRRLSVVHSPFEPPREAGERSAARAMLIEELGVPADTRFLGIFGLLIERKRPLAFVEAVAAFVRQHPELPVMGLFFGVPGKESPRLDSEAMRRAEELGIADRIRLMGFRHPVEPWMQAVDVLLVTAVREPFGRTLIEAMFLGTPVVATDDGGNPEAIEDGITGILVPPEKPEAFVEPVFRLLTDDGHRRRIVEAARQRAFASYGVEAHVAKLTALYEQLLSRPASAGAPARRTAP